MIDAITLFEIVGGQAKHLATLTQETYRRDLTDLASFLAERGVTRIDGVRLAHLQAYQRALAVGEKLSAASQNRKADAIKTFFRFLCEEEYIPFDPAERLIPPDAPEHEPRILTEDEYTRLRAACSHNPRDLAIIELVLQTGVRVSEVTALRLSDCQTA